MRKIQLPARLRFDFPTGIVVISCWAGQGERPNLLTAGAISHACIDPPMLGVAVGHTRYTYEIISAADGFVVNVPSRSQAWIVDFCGSASGREVNKYEACGLTVLPSHQIASPGIAEFPVNIECATRHHIDLGSHTFFFGEIVAVHCAQSVLSSEGRLDPDKLRPLTAFLDSYWDMGEVVLQFGSWKQARGERQL